MEILATTAKLFSNQNGSDYRYIYSIPRNSLRAHLPLFLSSYPTDDINRLWKLLCLNQFHDCLPGSAINLAYVDVHKVVKTLLNREDISANPWSFSFIVKSFLNLLYCAINRNLSLSLKDPQTHPHMETRKIKA